MTRKEAIRIKWEIQYEAMKNYLLNKGFSEKGAELAIMNFIETMIFCEEIE